MAVARGRSAAIDVLRVCALVAIVLRDAQVTGDWPGLLSPWSFSVFLFLAGWLWKPARPMPEEWLSRARSVLIPVASWSLVAGAAWLMLLTVSGPGTGSGAGPGAGDEAGMVDGFGCLGGFVLVCLARRRLDRFGDGPAVAVAVGLWLGGCLLGSWFDVPGLVGTGLAALVILVAGERARSWTPSLGWPVLTGSGLLAGSFALTTSGFVTPFDLAAGGPGTPVVGTVVVVAASWGMLLLVDGWVRRLPLTAGWLRVAAGLGALATVAVPVMLGHELLSYLLVTPAGGPRSGAVVVSVLALVMPWAVGLTLARTPLAWLLVGEHRAPPRPQLRIVRPGEVPPARVSHLSVVRIPAPRSPVADSRFS